MGEVVLALDVGDARIGVARAETDLALAFGRGALTRASQAADVAAVAELAACEGATCVVVGLPIRTDGADSEQTRRVRAFAASLAAAGLNVELEDERFTTRIAERQLATGSLPRNKRHQKGRVDEASAVLILESWLRRRAGVG